jgi:hypothetical protein
MRRQKRVRWAREHPWLYSAGLIAGSDTIRVLVAGPVAGASGFLFSALVRGLRTQPP